VIAESYLRWEKKKERYRIQLLNKVQNIFDFLLQSTKTLLQDINLYSA